MRRRVSSIQFAVVPLVVLAVACGPAGADDESALRRAADGSASTNSVDAAPTIESVVDQPPTAQSLKDQTSTDCDSAWERIATAVEAHYSEKGFDVATLDELTQDRRSWQPTDWTLEEHPGGAPIVVGAPGGPCDGYTGNRDRVPEQPIPADRQSPVSETDLDCLFQEPMLTGAVYAYAAERGDFPASQDMLIDAGLIPFEFDLYDINGPGSVGKTFDGDCFLRSADLPALFDEYNSFCFADHLRLKTAVDSHQILVGSYPESMGTLVEREYLFGVVTNYFTDGSGDLISLDPTFCPQL